MEKNKTTFVENEQNVKFVHIIEDLFVTEQYYVDGILVSEEPISADEAIYRSIIMEEQGYIIQEEGKVMKKLSIVKETRHQMNKEKVKQATDFLKAVKLTNSVIEYGHEVPLGIQKEVEEARELIAETVRTKGPALCVGGCGEWVDPMMVISNCLCQECNKCSGGK